MTARNLPLVEANLTSLGLASILSRLLSGPLSEAVEMNFGSLKTAKTVQRHLYNWLYFYPQIKEGLAVTLNEPILTLIIKPKGLPEKRGRRGGKI